MSRRKRRHLWEWGRGRKGPGEGGRVQVRRTVRSWRRPRGEALERLGEDRTTQACVWRGRAEAVPRPPACRGKPLVGEPKDMVEDHVPPHLAEPGPGLLLGRVGADPPPSGGLLVLAGVLSRTALLLPSHILNSHHLAENLLCTGYTQPFSLPILSHKMLAKPTPSLPPFYR